MRSRCPACRTLPSSTVRTPSSRPICRTSASLPLKANADVREATRSASIRRSALMISSVMPSLKYSASAPGLMLRNGRTAIEASRRVPRAGASPRTRAAVLGRRRRSRLEREGEVARRLEALLRALLEAVRRRSRRAPAGRRAPRDSGGSLLEDGHHRLDRVARPGRPARRSASRRGSRRTRRGRSGGPPACRGPARATCSRASRRRCRSAVSDAPCDPETLAAGTSAGRARPKSRILTMPSRVRKTLSGFRSRWTMPAVVRRGEPARDLLRVVERLARRDGGRASRSRSVSPSSSSITAYATPPSRPKSWIARMFGCESAATACASRSNRASASALPAESVRQHLDRDVALEPRVPRPVHLSHAARAERRQDLVRAEAGARRESH